MPVAGLPTVGVPATGVSGVWARAVGPVGRRLPTTAGGPRWTAAVSPTPAPSGAPPFAAWVDHRRRLWLEEYPRYPFTASETVTSGHIVGIIGVYDGGEAMGRPPVALRFLQGPCGPSRTRLWRSFVGRAGSGTTGLAGALDNDSSAHEQPPVVVL